MKTTASSTRGEPGDYGSVEKQLDHIMGPKDIRSTTWYLNKVRVRTWDHRSRGQGHYDCFKEQEQIMCAGRDQGYAM